MSKKQAKDGRICANCKRFVWDSNKETGWCSNIEFTLLYNDEACGHFEPIY